MITVLKNDNGYVYAYCEWEILNKEGQFENDGDIVYVQNIWVQKKERYKDAVKELIELMYKHPYTQNSNYVYFVITRDKDNKKILESEERPYIKKTIKRYKKNEIYQKITQM